MSSHDFNLKASNYLFECTSEDGKYWLIHFRVTRKNGGVRLGLHRIVAKRYTTLVYCNNILKDLIK